MSLLCKRCWRLTEKIVCLWCRVFVSRYGVEGGSLGDGWRLASVWWNNLLSIQRGDGEGVGRWFIDHIRCELGDGVETLFWWDPWLEEGILKERFSRLFYLLITNW